MREIRVTVRDKIATGDRTRIVCGNSDYMVHFDLDAEWEQFAVRTMIVINADKTYREYTFTGNAVALPVIKNQLVISIGLYAGNLHTTTPAYFDCEKSARCGLGEHDEPPEDVYHQLVALVESGILKGEPGPAGPQGEQGEPGKNAVAEVTREEFERLSEEKMSLADYTKEISTSVINPALFENASIQVNTGKYIVSTNGHSHTACKEYIPVEAGTEYTFKFKTSVTPSGLYADFYAERDESTWISRVASNSAANSDGQIEFTTPAAANYVRFCFYKSQQPYEDVMPSDMLLYVTGTEPVLEGERAIKANKLDIAGIHEEMVNKGLIDGGVQIPHYYNAYIDGKCARIRELLDGCAGVGDVFMFITDQHWSLNAQQSPALMNYIAKHVHIPRVFSGGDTADTLQEQYVSELSAAFDGDIHHCVGNHDYSNEMNGNKLAYIMDMGKKEQIGNAKRHYYYVDNPQQSIRYIILCAFSNDSGEVGTAYDTEQINWLRDVALNVEEGWTVIVVTHSLYYGFGVDASLRLFPDGAADVQTVLDGATCDVACVVQGHAHLDRIIHTPGGIPVVLTTSDKYMPWMSGETNNEPWLTESRHLGTITEQAFDVVVLDKAERKLTFVRIGAPADNWTDGASTGTVEERVVAY